MTTLDSKLPLKVSALLEKYGVNVDITHSVKAWLPDGTVSETSQTTETVKISPPAPFTHKLDSNTGVLNQCKCYLAAYNAPLVPAVGDVVSYLGVNWSIVAVIELRSGDSVAAWELWIQTQQF